MLLLDENLSPKLAVRLDGDFPGVADRHRKSFS